MKHPKSLIFGAAGQDGFYLTQYLQSLEYVVVGADIAGETDLHLDAKDAGMVRLAVEAVRPDEIYYLVGLVPMPGCWQRPWEYHEVHAHGLLNVLDAIVFHKLPCKVFNAATSGMYGASPPPQDEQTPFVPLTPYDGSKLAGFHLAQMYRAQHGVNISSGILFTHESPRKKFGVVHKICETVAKMKRGESKKLELGNLDTVRDWSHASDIVRAMHLVLRQDPGDWAIGSGVGRTVRQLAETVLSLSGLPIGALATVRKEQRGIDPAGLIANPAKLKALGWAPQISFERMLTEKVEALA